jgi:hypothetical protein
MTSSGKVVLAGVLAAFLVGGAAQGGQPSVAITNPVSAVQYPDAIVIRIDGFDVLRRHYPGLRLELRPVGTDGVPQARQSHDLSASWEQPSVILQKEPGTTFNGLLVALRSEDTVILLHYIELEEGASVPGVPLQADTFAAIEPGQFLGAVSPVIPLPDLGGLATANLIGPPPRTENAESISRKVRCPVNYPMIASFNCAALTRQTGDPGNVSKRSLYIALKSQLFDPQTAQPTSVAHYLCEVPLDAAWLAGTNDLEAVLTASDIKVHATTNQYQGC